MQNEMAPFLLPLDSQPHFPPSFLAMDDPNGLLAVSFELSPDWLIEAYRHGVFPWSSEDEPVLWWSPAPRTVLFPSQIRIRRSLKKVIRNKGFTVTFDRAFADVLNLCATINRPGQDGTWLRNDLKAALIELHQQGVAHSVETWLNGELVGGLYGLAIGRVFFGESMFAKKSDASKVALVALAKQLEAWGFRMIDCQMETEHLMSMGAQNLSREAFEHILEEDRDKAPIQAWCFDPNLLKAI